MMETEKRLIERDKLIDQFQTTKVIEVFPNWKDMNPAITSAIIRLTRKYRQIILNAPTVDAVEVVRCKDCKNYDDEGYCWYWDYGAGMSPNTVDADDFCSHGERRTDEALQKLP